VQPTHSIDDARVHELFERHRDYARSLARLIAKELPSHVEFEELAQCADLGLLEAAQRFSPERGAQFSTFAYYRIRGAVFDGLRKLVSVVPRPKQSVATPALFDDLLERESGELGPDAGDEECAGRIGSAVRVLGTSFLLAHADEFVNERSAADDAEHADAVARVRELVDELDEVDRQLVQWLYSEGRSMTACADELGIDKAQISRRHARIVQALRAGLERVSE
jgi:RNA polymerase sigma factor for flagellar operon FliA